MSSFGQKKVAKKDYYLSGDRFLGFMVSDYHQGGRFPMKILALVYAIPAVCIMWKFYSKGQFWSGLFILIPYTLVLLPTLIASISSIHTYVTGKRVASGAVLLHVLRELDDRCSNNSVIHWRQIAHSANKLSEDRGELPVIFYSAWQCRAYVFRQVFRVVNSGGSVFHDKSKEAAKLHNDIAKSVVKKYNKRVQSFSKQSKTFVTPLSIEQRKKGLGTWKVQFL